MNYSELYFKEESIKFYEDRYLKGYMDEWLIGKQEKVFEAIKNLCLPESGEALDFGCGKGISTGIIKKALPKWNVYGMDISSVAIESAKKNYLDCAFFVSAGKNFDKKFDFVFSNHVLEHVYDISEAISEINRLMKDRASMLHVLPCANMDSFEYNICMLRKDGIDEKMENRFFFEDEGHVRRLTTEQVNLMVDKYGFELAKDYYAHQYYGAINWITGCDYKFILTLTDNSNAKDKVSAGRLKQLRRRLLVLNLLRFPSRMMSYIIANKNKKAKHYIGSLILAIPCLLSYMVDSCIKKKADIEWKTQRHRKNGSEMYLYYSRSK
ncbi:class I SAM-dependent methyltransferase [Candidatus Omnitrophota bacterium]